MRIFLTGATGFVGHHVARALAAEGAELRLLVRKSSNLANLEGIAGDTHVGDLSEPETLAVGARRLRCGGACGGRLPALDSRSAGDVQGQCGRDAGTAADGARGGCAACCLYVERGDDALPHRRDRDQRGHAGFACRHGGALQAVEVYGRAGGHCRRARQGSR